MAAHNGFAEGDFRTGIHISRIKIGKPAREKRIGHFAHAGNIDLPRLIFRQTHQTESQFIFHFWLLLLV